MPDFRYLAHKFLPKSLVLLIQKRNKAKRDAEIKQQAKTGGLTEEKLQEILSQIGIQQGDVLLVHAALSRMGYVEGGAKTVVNCLLKSVGESGHLLMPTSANNELQLDFIRNSPVFDVKNTPSKMGAISEFFRKLPDTKRSLHPTESVACIGPNATDFVHGHFNALTPYLADSPFGKVIEYGGKILMIGVTFDNAGTNVHCLEDATDFPFPVYHDQIFEAKIVDYNGNEHLVKTKVHNPEMSKKRHCDYLIPIFEEEGVLTKHKIGKANCLLIDAKGMFESLKNQLSKGQTIYGRV